MGQCAAASAGTALALKALTSSDDLHLVAFTALMAGMGTIAMVPIGLPLSWLLARRQWYGKPVVETLIALPLVLPPVATGLLLLKLFGRHSLVGGLLHRAFGLDIVFTWRAVLVAVSVMSFPLFVRSVRVAIEEVNPRLEQMASTLGANPWRVFWTVTVPLARRGLFAGMIMAFARALGEFGATIMVAGNIPGHTSTLSLAIFQAVEMGQDGRAWRLLGVSVSLAFVAVFVGEWLMRKRGRAF